jgi:SAM-dependent methyltransferase
MVALVVDKGLLRKRLRRALRRVKPGADFLHKRVAAELAERLSGVQRHFATAVIGTGQTECLANALLATGRIGRAYRLEAVPRALADARPGIVADEELLPLKAESIDLFVSALALQWSNDLPGALLQIRRSLRPDGLFLGAMTGGQTLKELRETFYAAEAEMRDGIGARVLPAAEISEVGILLQRAGFTLPVIDRDRLTVRYDSLFDLFADLRGMGATNVLVERDRRPFGRNLLLRAAAIYKERFGDPDGRIRATFEIIWLSGWAPDDSQQQPAERGSAKISLAEVLPPPRRNG